MTDPILRKEGDPGFLSGILDLVLASSPAGILVYDSSANCVMANETVARLAGGSVPVLLAQNFRALESWRMGGLLDAAEEALATRVMVERIFHSTSTFGAKVQADFRFSTFAYKEDVYLLVTILDISPLLKAEAATEIAEARLDQRLRAATATNEEMESFFYAVTHDLRAPLRAIGGFAGILEEDEGSRLSAEGVADLKVIRENVVRMQDLIEDLLGFARIGQMAMTRTLIDMTELIWRTWTETVSEEERARIDFSVSGLPPATGDPRLMERVLANLISNAVKFTRVRESAHIIVEGEVLGRELVYRIRDDGVGFDMRYAGKLFGIFQRLHSAKDYPGAGMGLAFVRRAIVRQGGRAWAEGEEGKGATFSFALPASDLTLGDEAGETI